MSRARQVADFDPALFAADEVSGDKVSGGTIGAGVIGASVTGGAGLSGMTSLGTVTAGTFEGTLNTSTTYPVFSKVGTFTRAVAGAPGDVSYTGVGFQPSVLHLVASIQDGPSSCFGISDGTTNLVTMYSYASTNHLADQIAGTPGANTGNMAIYIHYSATLGTKAIVKTMDADGFTLTWYDIGDPSTGTVVVMYTAFR